MKPTQEIKFIGESTRQRDVLTELSARATYELSQGWRVNGPPILIESQVHAGEILIMCFVRDLPDAPAKP